MDNPTYQERITLTDLTGAAPWLEMHGIPVELERTSTGKVVGYVPATNEVYRLLGELQTGPKVDLNEFMGIQRRIRGKMLDLRDGNGRRGRGNGYERTY
ncbi:MAG: hypothetical protein C0392_05805 [Syntrophus sp. (in: bacteria)]|nr:hypothetical protein [Syntrophus sp. (in: bacteria)]